MTNRTYRAFAHDSHNPAQAGGYSIAPGTVIDMDAVTAATASQFVLPMLSGPTSARPVEGDLDRPPGPVRAGALYYDSTVGAVVVFTGKFWRSLVDGSVQ